MCTALQKPVKKSKQLTDWLRKVPEHSACDPPSRIKGIGNIGVDLAASRSYKIIMSIKHDKTLKMKHSD